jgi:hypothetical protein
MQHIKTFSLVLAILAASAGNAAAEGFQFNTPDISNKLTALVETRMNELILNIYGEAWYTRIVLCAPDGQETSPVVVKERFSDSVERNQS